MHLRASLSTALDALKGASYLLPDYVAERVENLDPAELDELGIRYVVFDFDNTLARWGARKIPASAEATIRRLRAAGIGVAVASNGYPRRFWRLGEEWSTQGVRFVGGCGKPDPGRLRRLLEEQEWDPCATLVVGDNTLTDAAAGRGAGCATAVVRPLSWWEAPPTKLWRVLEVVHRLRRGGWAGIPRLGVHSSDRKRAARPGKAVGMTVAFGVALVLLAPMARHPAPGSETTSYQLGLARAFMTGWPAPGEGDADRSLLLMAALSRLPDHTSAPLPLTAAFLVLLVAGVVACAASVPSASPLATTVLVMSLSLAPVTIVMSGEISPSTVELATVAAALVLPLTPLVAAALLCVSLLNGVSAVALIPVLLIRSPQSMRGRVTGAMAVATLIATACWVVALSRPPAPGPSLNLSLLTVGAGSPGMGEVSGMTAPGRIEALESGLRRALLGKSEGFLRLPLLSLTSVCAVLSLARRAPVVAAFVLVRGAVALLLPGLFLPSMTLVVLVPFIALAMGSVFEGVRRGRGTLLFALLLGLVVLPSAPTVRRQVAAVRQSYRGNGEVTLLAKAARAALPPSACIAAAEPARVFLLSGHSTVPYHDAVPLRATHIILPRTEPVGESCLATKSLMMCPR